MTGFVKFPSIESFGHVYQRFDRGVIRGAAHLYGAKIKIHGTNAGVRLYEGEVYAQSRSRDITPDDDNSGFAAWVEQHKAAWRLGTAVVKEPVTYFGEWAGKGIQKGDAVTQLSRKYFFVFAVQVGDEMHTDPEWIETAIPDIDNVVVLPWHMTFDTPIIFSKVDAVTGWLNQLNEEVARIGVRDPFIAAVFGIDGPGEGLVVMPAAVSGGGGPHGLSRDAFSDKTFKVKAARHAVKQTKKAASKEIEIPEGVAAFVEAFVTGPRCEQALTVACEGIAERARTSHFLKWIGQDIKKESDTELSEMGLTWKDVSPHVTKAAVSWFMDRCGRIPGVRYAA